MYRLIIADDEENIRNGMANSLPWREWGYEVAAVCASGQEVLDRMEDCRPDVVLSDIRMPGMDGVELMQRLSREYPQVKIVILSGYSDFKYLNMSIRSHVAEYLLKPTDIDDFEETFRRLKAAMDHERLRRAQITESVLRHFHVWLTAMLGGVATPEDTDRFLPMLTEAGIDLDNLQVAAFVLDGHGGDERPALVALGRWVWEVTAARPAGPLRRLSFLLSATCAPSRGCCPRPTSRPTAAPSRALLPGRRRCISSPRCRRSAPPGCPISTPSRWKRPCWPRTTTPCGPRSTGCCCPWPRACPNTARWTSCACPFCSTCRCGGCATASRWKRCCAPWAPTTPTCTRARRWPPSGTLCWPACSGASRPWPPAAAATAMPSKAWPCGCGNMWTPNTAPTTTPCSRAIPAWSGRKGSAPSICLPGGRCWISGTPTRSRPCWSSGLDVANPDKLGRFFFYPLQKNFLSTETYGEPRRDMVVLGSRQDLEMQVLMSQINPHFLYNTLESIVWKAGEAGRPDIGKLASSLGKLYRLSISGGLFVPLEQELEHVQMYMNIQRSRYGNKVDYEVRLHGVDPDQVEVLKLILQPIVENSLLYGMEGLDHTLRIRVAAWRRGEKLLLTVTDNGVGMDRAALARLRDQIVHGRKPRAEANYRSTGIGLHNIGARLRLYAGSTSCIKVQSRPHFGTRVTLELPWRAIGTE